MPFILINGLMNELRSLEEGTESYMYTFFMLLNVCFYFSEKSQENQITPLNPTSLPEIEW